jgi:O-antigen ligase
MEAGAERHARGSVRFIRDVATAPSTIAARALAISMLLLPVAYIEPVLIPVWTPRMAVALLVVPIGLSRFAIDLRRGDRPTIWLAGFMVSCTIGTLITEAPVWNIRGGFGRDSSLTFLLILAAFWAGARSLDRDGRRLVIAASLTGTAMSGAAAMAQVVLAPSAGILALLGSRPGGLFGNPVYLGAIAAGACSLAAVAWARGSCPVGLGFGAVALFTSCVSLAGSRGAVIGLAAGVGAGLVKAEGRTRLALAASAAAGWLGAVVLSNVNDGRDVAARVSLADAGRSTVWRYSVRAILDRPVFGHGFGQYRAAVQGYFSPEFVRDHARDPFQDAWPDAHNVVLQYGVVGGLVALAFLAAFVYSAARHARGPAAWAATAVVLTWLLQPVNLATGPMCLAWLGIAMAPKQDTELRPSSGRSTQLLLALGGVMAVSLLVVDQRINLLLDRPTTLSTLVEQLPSDPVLASTAANRLDSIRDFDGAAYWARRWTDLEPFSAVASARLAELLVETGDGSGAAEEIRRSFDQDPYNPETLRTGLGIALVTKDDELFELVRARLDELGLD